MNVGAWPSSERAAPGNAALDPRAAALLAQPPPGSHIVQPGARPAVLAAAMAAYVSAGLRTRDGVIVITNTPRWQALCRTLDAAGFDTRQAVAAGRLRFFGAAWILVRWIERGRNEAAFDNAVGDVVRLSRIRHASVRVCSELADILWRRGHTEEALRLGQCRPTFIERQPPSAP